ncbi:MAG: hypothetical protein PF486_12860 [Prolixibacteraceae bacterium]|jgi:amino acid transporter|nr:hypothetical protein [Prolixibacteraceae bacterium]
MNNLFKTIDPKTLIAINASALVITTISEIFALYILFTKGQSEELPEWKANAIIIGVVLVSILFLFSVVSMVLFLHFKTKNKEKS